MGRLRTPGTRLKSGKKKRASTLAARAALSRILPTPETMAYIDRRVSYWTHPGLWNLAAAEHCYDNAGILCATGWFDGHGFLPEEIRNAFREYAGLYWRWYAELSPKISRGERGDRAEPSNLAAGWELYFQKLDARLPNGSERRALHQLCVDGWHFDEMHPHAVALANLGRLKINARLKGEKLGIAGQVAHENGREAEWLGSALRGVFLLMDARVEHTDIPLWRMTDAA